jgi:peptidyl-prolyl cis-trans isomerase B (cyclophilin B)
VANLPRVTSLRRLCVLLVVLFLAGSLAACGSDTTTPRAKKGQCEYPTDPTGPAKKVDAPPLDPPKDVPTEVTIATNRGDIKVSLDADQAPCTVNSFVSLAKQGYFDHTHCHRLTVGTLFVLQCGNPVATGKPADPDAGTGGPGYYVKDELVKGDPRLQPCLNQTEPATGKQICTYTTGTVAMANAGPDTGGSQFFLVYKDSQLPNAYTAFGRMSAAGVKVVQSVAAGGAYPEDARQNTPPKLQTVITSVK